MTTSKRGISLFKIILISFIGLGFFSLIIFERLFPNLSERLKAGMNSATIEYCTSKLPPRPSLRTEIANAFSNLVANHLIQQGNYSPNNRVEIRDNSDTLIGELVRISRLNSPKIKGNLDIDRQETKTIDQRGKNTKNNLVNEQLYELEIFRKDPKIPRQLIIQISTFDQHTKNKTNESAIEFTLETILDKKKPDSN